MKLSQKDLRFFYNAYPKKNSRDKALSWFKTHKPDSSFVD